MENVCSDCRHNPEAKRPFAKMHHVKMTQLTQALVSKLSKQTKENVNCIACRTTQGFWAKPCARVVPVAWHHSQSVPNKPEDKDLVQRQVRY